ncbi:hypothetical protein [Erythrobacter sp.]|uniref:hypothetical protein n=1 Tax=Erythrobacter sp. TaxID=1042 RepID=UPI002EA536A6|nr:hypothetical protein [Erythrobacter sp.]
MKPSLRANALALAGLVALAGAQPAQAQQPICVQSADLSDTVTYALPLAYDAAMRSCAASYGADSFMRTGAPAFVEGFRALQDDSWPGTFRFLRTFMAAEASGGDPAINAMIATLPEENLRPFVDGLVVQMIGGEIKPDSCGAIERGMELLSPLPAQNVAGLATFIAELADVDNPPICGTVTLEAAAE